MRINPNSEPLGVTITPAQTEARVPRLEADKLSLDTSEKLNRALTFLEQAPAMRAEKVAQAKRLIADISYPPPELIHRISALIALGVEEQTGPAKGTSD